MTTRPIFVAAVCGALVMPATAQDLSSGSWIDLTHSFNGDTIYWPTAKMFEKEIVFEGQTDGGFYYSAYNFSAAEHGGTHLDAPVHFAEGALTADALPVEQLIGPGVVIDVTRQSAKDIDYLAVQPQQVVPGQAESADWFL